MRLFPVLLMMLLLPATLWAQCDGVDLRATLTEPEQAEIAARLDGVPFTQGNHWTATRDGRSIHVIGTMHIDDPRMDAVAERLAPLIATADAVLVEATLEDQKQLQIEISTNPDLAFLTGQTLIDLLPADKWETLAAAAKARGIPSFMAAKFQPWYLSLILSMSPCTLQEVAAGAKGLDQRIMDLAAQAEVPTGSLEPYTTVFSLFGQGSMEDQLEMLTIGTLPDAHSENATATLVAQYFEQRHRAALETSRVTSRPVVDLSDAEFDAVFDQFMGLLVDQRNHNWMDVIDATEGDRIVVAAGALHLGGEAGVLNLLARRGYTLRRAAF